MGDITGALRTAQSGLQTNQQALNVISQNISNVNTPGYSRRIIQQESNVINGVPAGVQIADVQRAVDDNLIKNIRRELSELNNLTAQNPYYDRLQEVFGAPEDNTSIAHQLEEFQNAAELLAVSPNRVLEQNEFIRRAVELLDNLSNLSTTIQDLRLQADQQITTLVDEANTIVSDIDQLNDDIISIGSVGNDTSDLEDNRDLRVDRLAEIFDIRFFNRNDGDVVVFLSTGETLVDTVPPEITHTGASSLTPTATHGSGEIDGIFIGDRDIAKNDVTTTLTGGLLGGLVNMRDDVLPDLQSQLDELASNLQTVVNQVHNQGASYPGQQSYDGQRIVDVGAGLTPISITASATDTITFTNVAGTNNDTIQLAGDNTFTDLFGNQLQPGRQLTINGGLNNGQTFTIVSVTSSTEVVVAETLQTEVTTTGSITTPTLRPTMTIDSNDDSVFTLFDDQGNQQASVRLSELLTGTVDNVQVGTGVDVSSTNTIGIAQFAARLEDWLQANGAASATAAIGSDGRLDISVSQPGLNLAIRDEAGRTNGSTQEDAQISWDANADGVNDETFSGLSNFFGLNDFFVDQQADNLYDSQVLSTGYVTTAATISFTSTGGFLSSGSTEASLTSTTALSVSAGLTLSELATLINNNIPEITASVVPDGSGERLRLANDEGETFVVTQASGNTLLDDLSLVSKRAGLAATLTVRSDIQTEPGLIATARVQFDSTKGANGEYLLSTGDNANIEALAENLAGTQTFKLSGGLPQLSLSFTDYASSIIGRNSALAESNTRAGESQAQLTEALQFQSESVRGVNLDEELANLVIFEQAYSAAARVLTVVQRLIDELTDIVR